MTTSSGLPSHEAVEGFLAAFFAAPNLIRIAEITVGGKSASLVPWVSRLRRDMPVPSVLPCRRANGRVEWYALAFSEPQLHALGDNLNAFVGPTYSTFRGHRAQLDPTDPQDFAAIGLCGDKVFKFSPAVGDKQSRVWERLELMRTVTARRPDKLLDAPRATGRVLRDFYMSLRARDASSAETCLRYLTEHQRLTPDNILFLRVYALAELGEWDAVLAREELPDLLRMRRPIAVTEAVLKAVYHVELASFENEGDATGAVDRFRSVVLPKYGSLLARRAGIHAPEALKLFMLLAVAGEPPDPGLRDAIWSMRGIPEDDRLYLKVLSDRLLAPAPPAQHDATISSAWDAFNAGDYERAYADALIAPATADRARLLVACAYEIQTLEAERNAALALAALGAAGRDDALRGRWTRDALAAIRGKRFGDTQAIDPPPADWLAWLERTAQQPDWPGALDIARRGATEWGIESVASAPDGPDRMVELLQASNAAHVIQYALPHLVGTFERDSEWPRPELAVVYRTALNVLAVGSTGVDADVQVYSQLLDAVLSLGLNLDDYVFALDGARLLITEYPTPGRVNCALEMLETSVMRPCADESSRLSLLTSVVGLVQKFWRRVDGAQRSALRLLADDLGHPELFSQMVQAVGGTDSVVGSEPDVLAQLNGRMIAIYTLTERAGRYMKQILAERAPHATVHVASDKVASENLRHLARRADVFIMATASAKHAATEFIEANRAKDRPLLRPGGKGMASMLSALESFLRSESAVEEVAA